MSKKKSKKSEPTKAERKALKAREAEIRAELERRAAEKAAKKKAKKGKAEKPAKGKKSKPLDVEPMTISAEPEAPVTGDGPTPEEVEAVAERAKPLKGDALKAALEADTAAAKARKDAETDEEIRARVLAKRAAREAAAAEKPGSPERLAKMQADVAEGKKKRAADRGDAKIEALGAEGIDAMTSADTKVSEAASQAAEIVETETGREFSVGESVAQGAPEDFAKPSDGGPELEEGRNGYKIIMLGADGKPDPRKVRQLTRVTTFVGNIDDETTLKQWEKRLLAEGLSAHADEYAPRVNDIVHRREVAIAKARKADRKGKLGLGELAEFEAAAMKASKDALNALVEEALEAAGRNDKADAGTNLHALAEIADAEGLEPIREKHVADEITMNDLASIEAYRERMDRLGAKVIESEAVIVNDAMGYAGRLDRIIMARLPQLRIPTAAGVIVRPADKRARRYVADIKSGRIDLGAGKIARQLAAYALGDLYNLETGERTRHSAATDIALVFHLPQGTGKCTVHAVDIKAGAALLKLSAEVRRARNTGKKTIDTSVDIADPASGPEEEGE